MALRYAQDKGHGLQLVTDGVQLCVMQVERFRWL